VLHEGQDPLRHFWLPRWQQQQQQCHRQQHHSQQKTKQTRTFRALDRTIITLMQTSCQELHQRSTAERLRSQQRKEDEHGNTKHELQLHNHIVVRTNLNSREPLSLRNA
jgi:hypothetical protein